MDALRIVPLTAETWDSFAEFARRTPPLQMCWCQFWRLRSKDFGVLKVPELRDRLRAQTSGDAPPGLVALEGDRAVGWVSLGPRTDFARIEHSKVIPRIDDRPVWSIVCFAVSASARGRGIGRALLDAAVEHARTAGATALEAYPVALEAGEASAAGSASLAPPRCSNGRGSASWQTTHRIRRRSTDASSSAAKLGRTRPRLDPPLTTTHHRPIDRARTSKT